MGALVSVWKAVGQRHEELPPVLMGIGRGSRRGAKRRTLGHFGACAWVPVRESGQLDASSKALAGG